VTYFGGRTNAAPAADPDADGLDNQDEFITGTDPTNRRSVLGIDTVTVTPTNTLVLTWPSVSGRTYAIGRATNLLTGSFLPVASNIPATPPVNSAPLTLPAGDGAFFNVRARKD